MAASPRRPSAGSPTSPASPHDFPAALAAASTLTWKSRRHRVRGDILWPQGDFTAATQALRDGRAEAEQHDAPGERAIAQTRLALVTAFTNPARANEEITLARQYLEPLDQRATALLLQVAALIRDAGTDDRELTERATVLRTRIDVVGLPWLIPLLETALAEGSSGEADPGSARAARRTRSRVGVAGGVGIPGTSPRIPYTDEVSRSGPVGPPSWMKARPGTPAR